MIWIQFIISAAVIIAAGTRLTKSADILSDRLNIGKAWIGVILLGLITSLPEAIASFTAIVSLKAPDLAIGNLAGSNNFNPLLIVVMDIMYRQGSITNKIHSDFSHRLAALFSIVMSLVVLAELLAPFGIVVFGTLTLEGVVIIAIYFLGMKKLAGLGMKHSSISRKTQVQDQLSINKIYLQLAVSAALVVFSAIWMTRVCDTIAFQTGWGRTFVGSILLALATSLPEMVVSIAALKINSYDLAVGNILGSNMTNTFIIVLCGMFTKTGPILGMISKTHMVTIVLSILLTAILIVGIKMNNKKTVFGIGLDSILMLTLFLTGTRILYQLR